MIYLPDTNVCIGYLKQPNSRLVQRWRTVPRDSLRLCSVVKAELLLGAAKSRWGARVRSQLQALFEPYESLAFDDRAAVVYAEIRGCLERAGTPIGPNDYLIAAIALANNLILVTHNTREFSRVPGLRLEDWEE